jgi:hypothetical protein
MTKNRFTFLRLLIMLKTNVSIIAIFISDNDFFSFGLEILSSLKLSLKSLIVFGSSILLIDFDDFLSFRERLIADWSELSSFRKRTLMTIVRDFLEFLIESSNFVWSDWFKKDFFSKEMFFSLFHDDVVFVLISFEWVQNSE